MTRLRALRKHWNPFWLHVWLRPVNYAGVVVFFSLFLGVLAWLWRDPSWVQWGCAIAQAVYAPAWLALQILAYRHCTGHRLDKSQTYDRDDIWKDRWPW